MDDAGIAGTCFMLELADGFKERLALNVAHGTANLNDGNFCFCLRIVAVEAAFDFVGNMGDYLNGAAAEVSAALFVENGPVDLSCGHIGIPGKAFIDKALVVAKVQVCFGAVISHKHFSVLDRVHGAGVNVDVGVELLHGYLVASGF